MLLLLIAFAIVGNITTTNIYAEYPPDFVTTFYGDDNNIEPGGQDGEGNGDGSGGDFTVDCKDAEGYCSTNQIYKLRSRICEVIKCGRRYYNTADCTGTCTVKN